MGSHTEPYRACGYRPRVRERYVIVPDQSRMWIDGRSSVHPIRGSTDGLSGYIEIEGTDGTIVHADGTVAAQLSVPITRLSSGNRLEDRELQRRIDSRQFPTIDAVLTNIERADGDSRYRVQGDVAFRGVTRTYEEEMTIERVDERTIRLEGQSTFDVRDFGMEPPRILLLRVEPEVVVRVAIVAETTD
jgi:polyisoprenoid-binding protein YceI